MTKKKEVADTKEATDGSKKGPFTRPDAPADPQPAYFDFDMKEVEANVWLKAFCAAIRSPAIVECKGPSQAEQFAEDVADFALYGWKRIMQKTDDPKLNLNK